MKSHLGDPGASFDTKTGLTNFQRSDNHLSPFKPRRCFIAILTCH